MESTAWWTIWKQTRSCSHSANIIPDLCQHAVPPIIHLPMADFVSLYNEYSSNLYYLTYSSMISCKLHFPQSVVLHLGYLVIVISSILGFRGTIHWIEISNPKTYLYLVIPLIPSAPINSERNELRLLLSMLSMRRLPELGTDFFRVITSIVLLQHDNSFMKQRYSWPRRPPYIEI